MPQGYEAQPLPAQGCPAGHPDWKARVQRWFAQSCTGKPQVRGTALCLCPAVTFDTFAMSLRAQRKFQRKRRVTNSTTGKTQYSLHDGAHHKRTPSLICTRRAIPQPHRAQIPHAVPHPSRTHRAKPRDQFALNSPASSQFVGGNWPAR